MKSGRLVAALALGVLAVGSLTACQSHVGAAAFVGSQRISESTVGSYIGRDAKTTTQTDQSTGQTTTVNPKSQVLGFLIASDLFDHVLRATPGGEPSDSKIAAARQAVLTSNNVASIAQFETIVAKSGYAPKFADLYVDANAKFGLAEQALGDTDGSKVLAAIKKLDVSVDVSPRYGTWDPTSLGVSAGPSLPSFLKLAGTSAPSVSG